MKKRTWIISAGVLLVLGLASCGSDESNKSNKASEPRSSVSSSAKSENKLNKANFDEITIGENDGYTPEQTNDLFGKKANTVSDSSVENITTSMHIWNGVENGTIGSNVTVQYENGHAISKTISGLKPTPKTDLTDDVFNAIENGMSKEEVLKKLGNPSGYTYSNFSGYHTETLDFNQTKGGKTTSFTITFENGTVSGKTKSSI